MQKLKEEIVNPFLLKAVVVANVEAIVYIGSSYFSCELHKPGYLLFVPVLQADAVAPAT